MGVIGQFFDERGGYQPSYPGRGIILDASGALAPNVTDTTHTEQLRVTIPAYTLQSYDFLQLWFQHLLQNGSGVVRDINIEVILGATTLFTFVSTVASTVGADRRGDVFLRIRAQGATNSQAVQGTMNYSRVGTVAPSAGVNVNSLWWLTEFGLANEDGTTDLDFVVNAWWSGGSGLGYRRAAYVMWGSFISSVVP